MSKVPTTDQHRIEYLVLRRFPNAGSFQVPSSSGSRTRYTLPGKQKLRADVEAYENELRELPQGEIAALYTAERNRESEQQRLKAEADERARHFHQPHANADYNHWSRAAHWSLDEAIALSFGKAPEHVRWENVKPLIHVSPFAFQYARRRDLALRAVQWEQLFDPVLPGIFLAWCKRTDNPFPAELETAVTARGVQVADWRTRHDEAVAAAEKEGREWAEFVTKQQADWSGIVKERDELIARLETRIGELEGQPSKPQEGRFEKSLGTRERESLLKLVIGLAIGGYGYDPKAARSDKTAEIAGDLAEQGIALDEDTVRKWLRLAAKQLPKRE
jgi:hypothetical protein